MMDLPTPISVRAFLGACLEAGGAETEDALAAMLPLMRQCLELHDEGGVAPLDGLGALQVLDGRIFFEGTRAEIPRLAKRELKRIERAEDTTLAVASRQERHFDLAEGDEEQVSVEVAQAVPESLERPLYLPGFRAWEHVAGHHDALTDIFSLGMLLASLACHLDLGDPDELERFVACRGNLRLLQPRLHPVLAEVIERMTELAREKRAGDLRSLIAALENYHEQPISEAINLFWGERGPHALEDHRRVVCDTLRNRLFDLSRRNRLIYFRPTAGTVNLTVGSFPLLLDVRNVRPTQLLFWREELRTRVLEGRDLALGSYLRFDDMPFLLRSLDQVRRDAARDEKEFGFSQMRLVVAFLRWHNLKEAEAERIHSPLLLLPVELRRRKGIRDAYELAFPTTELEVNPALRHHLETLYGLHLPESIDLRETSPEIFFERLRAAVETNDPRVRLQCIDQPRIDLIRDHAKKRLERFRRAQPRRGRGRRQFAQLDYSYDREHFQPLGVQLFHRRVKPSAAPLRRLLSDRRDDEPIYVSPPETTSSPAVADADVSKEFYAVREGSGQANPFVWDFDLCALTLANFHYRKMSLVRDYLDFREGAIDAPSFDRLFALAPREAELDSPTIDLSTQHVVVPADPSQLEAIAHAQQGHSLIIQGPPGTGKSQTITNLIADYVARGKRVLFVCEKRAALDVVFNRLNQAGLGLMATVIHDSQADKKAFVEDLAATYEALQKPVARDRLDRQRDRIREQLEAGLNDLEQWSTRQRLPRTPRGTSWLDLQERAFRARSTGIEPPSLSASESELLPSWNDYEPWTEVLESLGQALEANGFGPVLAATPLVLLAETWLDPQDPIAVLMEHLDSISKTLEKLDTLLVGEDLDELEATLEAWDDAASLALDVAPLRERGELELLVPDSAISEEWAVTREQIAAEESVLAERAKANGAWKEKLPPEEARMALEQAEHLEHKAWRFASPAFWKLRGVLHRCYDFKAHQIPPPFSEILRRLRSEQEATEAVETLRREGAARFGVEDLEVRSGELEEWRERLERLTPDLRDWLLGNPGAGVVERLPELRDLIEAVVNAAEGFLADPLGLPLERLREAVDQLRAARSRLLYLLPELEAYREVPGGLRRAFESHPFTPQSFALTLNERFQARLFRESPEQFKFSFHTLLEKEAALRRSTEQWHEANGASLLAGLAERLQQHVRLTYQSRTQLSAEEQDFAKAYHSGRRELENEFKKSTRFKSIRSLVDGDSGLVVRDLKPVWLMSPLSVADTVPLDPDFFDVVIFDEASQILTEEAVPSLVRGRQTIVVGDEMQLPPTQFFASGENEDTLSYDDAGAVVEYDLNADSFLLHASRVLPPTLLGWHYRSRHEALIGFSNAHFYEGRLRTVPDRMVRNRAHSPIVVRGSEAEGCADLLARRISFHLLEDGCYTDRRNFPEAAYIARTLRALLATKTGHTIGIVAFSEAQQTAIEDALDELAGEDANFRLRLENEREREEDGEFVGLFVKNLENVQGDERDIIVISVCYGPDERGKVRMNFGPINKGGGEKRLNVIFSRARHHMAIVSSMRGEAVSNDYNVGANCLKQFLEYAELISQGQDDAADALLRRMGGGERESSEAVGGSAAVRENLAQWLEAEGYVVDRAVGQSALRCDLAVREADDAEYRLGLIIEGVGLHGESLPFDRFVHRPGLLEGFGWRIFPVLVHDWRQRPEAVRRAILGLLRGQSGGDLASVDLLAESPEAVGETTVGASVASESSPDFVQRLEYRGGRSEKFYEVSISGGDVTVRFGRIGKEGQRLLYAEADPSAARRKAEALLAEKRQKGYVAVESN